MKENNFKVGDRVRVYSFKSTSINGLYEFKAHIKGIDGCGILRVVERGTGIEYRVWPQQCRRLVPKKKKPGDEIWINLSTTSVSYLKVDGWTKYKRCK